VLSNFYTGISDVHNMIYTVLRGQLQPFKRRTRNFRSYKSLVKDDFLNDLSTVPFHICEIFDDIDDVYGTFNDLAMSVIDEHIPTKSKQTRKHEVPYRKARNLKAMYYHRFRKCKTSQNWEKYRKQRNLCVKIKNKSIKQYFESKCAAGSKNKDFYPTIKPFLSNKSNNNGQILLAEDDHIVNDATEICQIFNNFFVSIADDIGPVSTPGNARDFSQHPSVHSIETNRPDKSFVFKPVNIKTIEAQINKLVSKKATGTDGLPPQIVKMASPSIAGPLTSIVNKTISTSAFPSLLKSAEILPIHKKNDKLDKSNYRPVSILPSVSKIYEGILNDQIGHFFEDIYSPYLSGFRKGHSCQTLLMRLVEDWKKALDSHKVVGTILMDLSKAFDCLPHDLLLSKLKAYGFEESSITLMNSYLSHRKQRVKINECNSNWQQIRKGVPQGSILGPTLFNIFINDLFDFIKHTTLFNYADDNTLSSIGSSTDEVVRNLQTDANSAIKWFSDNHMKANPGKFQAMLLGSTEDVNFRLGQEAIDCTDCVSLLGMEIDNKLSFDKHLSKIIRKAASQLNALSRLSKFLDTDARKNIYNAYIMSNFNYCSVVWHFCSARNNKKLESIQNRALRFVHSDFKSNYEQLLSKGNNCTLHLSRLRSIAIETYKAVNKLSPNYVQELFKSRSSTHNLRNSDNLSIPRVNTTHYGLNSLSFLAPKVWNSLPPETKSSISLFQFKNNIKSWMGVECKCSFCKFSS
jgi:hypothetical protein